jgi:hypothetical protein
MTAAQLAVGAENRAGRGFNAAADLLEVVARGQGFQPFHFLAELELAVVPTAGDAFREYPHGGRRVMQILAHPRHLFARLVPIIAEFSAQGSLHRVVMLRCGSLAALRVQRLQALPEIFGATRIQFHGVFRG